MARRQVFGRYVLSARQKREAERLQRQGWLLSEISAELNASRSAIVQHLELVADVAAVARLTEGRRRFPRGFWGRP